MAISTGLCAAGQKEEIRITVVATSDIHGNFFSYDYAKGTETKGGWARVQTYLQQWDEKRKNDGLILLDCGDILQGSPATYYYNFVDTLSTHLCADILNYMGYDAVVPGNHDIETGHSVYDRWAGQCRMPVLSANIINKGTGKAYFKKPYTIIERQGIRIAVLGMVTPAIPQWMSREKWEGMSFADIKEAARFWIPILRFREKADIIIGLFHSGTGKARCDQHRAEHVALNVARQIPGFDLVICGHDHHPVIKRIANVREKNVLLLNPGAEGDMVARADIFIYKNKKGIERITMEGRLDTVANLQPDPTFLHHFSQQNEKVRSFASQAIGRTTVILSTRPAFFGSSAFVDFIHKVQLETTGADISFCSPLGVDVEIPRGTIHESNLFSLYPYENTLSVIQMTGEEILRYLEYSYAGWINTIKAPTDHLLHFSPTVLEETDSWKRLATPCHYYDSAAGIRYEVDVTQEAGHRVHILSMADGRPFDLGKSYHVAINSYRIHGGGRILTEGAGLSPADISARTVSTTPRDLRHYIAETIRKQGTISPQASDNWRFVPRDKVKEAVRADSLLLFDE